MTNKNILLAALIFILVSFMACNDDDSDEVRPAPTINLKSGEGLIVDGSAIKAGAEYQIGILAESNGTDNLTNLTIKSGDVAVVNESMYQHSLDKIYTIIKNTEKSEVLTINIMDENRGMSSTSLTIVLDTTEVSPYNELFEIKSVKLGAQENNSVGSFYSISENKVYNYIDASANQTVIDIAYYFGKNNRTLGSPNLGSEADLIGVDTWDTKNETTYVKTSFTPEKYDSFKNDSIMLEATSFAADDWKRKGKEIEANDVYYFKTHDNKFGLLKIINASGETDGEIEFAYKIQQ